MAAIKYFDATPKRAGETNGAITLGIARAGVVKGAGTIVDANGGLSVTITGATWAAGVDVAKFGANPNGTFPKEATRPALSAKGEVQYDPTLNMLVNNKTGRRSALQGLARYMTGTLVKDTGTGRTYRVIRNVAL